MKTSIGIRANPNAVYYCILRGSTEEFEITQVDRITNPKALSIPEQLKFLRSTLRDIIQENTVKLACIRITESTARNPKISRIYIEGVIQELIASSSIENYYVGQISSISAKAAISRDKFKPFVKGEETFLEIQIWDSFSLEERESLIAAYSALNL